MSKSLFIAYFMAFSTALLGQSKPDKTDVSGNRRSDTYYFKKTNYDSVRFTIQGQNDTVFIEMFWRNGQSNLKNWVHDSLYVFNNQGFTEQRVFYLKPKGQSDSTVLFYENGQIKSIVAQEKGVFYRSKEFDKDGLVTLQRADKFVGKYGRYSIQRDSSDRILYTTFTDTTFTDSSRIMWHYDTLFYPNGQPYLIQIKNQKRALNDFVNNDYHRAYNTIKCDFYDKKGRLVESLTPDSLRLLPFKDNVDCYYGLKTVKGDTIFKPRFDRIVKIDDNLLAVYEGAKCRLMHLDGRFLATPDMESVEKLSGSFTSLDNFNAWEQWENRNKLINFPNMEDYFVFSAANKYGVINRKGALIVPLQTRRIDDYGLGTNDTLFHFTVQKSVLGKSETVERGMLNRAGLSLFPNFINMRVIESNRYFEVSNDVESLESPELLNFWGLINNKDQLLLPCKFSSISKIGDSDLFGIHVGDVPNEIKDKFDLKWAGIFDAKNRRWLVDTSRKVLALNAFSNGEFVTIQNEKTKKMGLIDAKGKTIFPLIYDDLRLVNEAQQLFIAHKNGIYQFLNVVNKPKRPTYEFLAEIAFDYDFNGRSSSNISLVFLAKRHGKWGVVDSNDHVLRPFVSDYAAYSNNTFFLVDNATVHYFDANSFPQEADLSKEFDNQDAKISSKNLADEPTKLFFFNEKGKVVIPPQYNAVSEDLGYFSGFIGNYILVEDAQKKRKLISTETGEIIDFPFDYKVNLTANGGKIIGVSDSKLSNAYSINLSQSWGVVTTDGRQLTPCDNAGIAFADAKIGTYFVRRDTPTTVFRPFIAANELDTLGVADNDWFLYNSLGKLVDSTAFRFPIYFNSAGIGVGMKGEKFGLYRADGSIVAPPQYKNILRDKYRGFYYLFENQGLSVTVSLKKRDGTTFLKSGRYDAVSPFYGEYALVRSAGKIGLIDSFGREIIAPQDLYTFNKVNLYDSLRASNKRLDVLGNEAFTQQIYGLRSLPFSFYLYESPDSLDLSDALRNALWHLMIEKTQDDIFWQTTDIKIERSKQHTGIYYNEYRSCTTGRVDDENRRLNDARRFIVSDKTLAFVLGKDYFAEKRFFNFYYKNNRWNELTINDLLQVQGEKRWQLNDLLIQKIKQLKDEEIDCSNMSAFIGQVENRFMLTEKGVDFCFESNKNRRSFAVVAFTWAELQPFLKMRL